VSFIIASLFTTLRILGLTDSDCYVGDWLLFDFKKPPVPYTSKKHTAYGSVAVSVAPTADNFMRGPGGAARNH
jgi:hypothetical protein